MKKSPIVLMAICSAMFMSAQENIAVDITLEITNIDSSKGKIMIGLYQDEGNWLKQPYKGIIGEIEDGKCIAVFEDIQNGTYAISVFHDENNNNKLDMYLGFMPKEDTGCSNNAPANFGPPKWSTAKFELKGESIEQTIKL